MVPCSAVAVTQPHDTRTLVMRIVELVLFVRRYEWVSVGPTGTPPKSWLSLSNIPSAQDAAGAGRAITTPATAARQNRCIVSLSLCPDPDARHLDMGHPRRVARGRLVSQLLPPAWACATGDGGTSPHRRRGTRSNRHAFVRRPSRRDPHHR